MSDQCRKIQFSKLVHATSDSVDQARLIAWCSPGTGDWLPALPISSVGRKMDNATVRISAGLRLGAPVLLFASIPAYAEQRLLLMAITVSLAVVVLVVTAATI